MALAYKKIKNIMDSYVYYKREKAEMKEVENFPQPLIWFREEQDFSINAEGDDLYER
jgi:hypothetical protein